MYEEIAKHTFEAPTLRTGSIQQVVSQPLELLPEELTEIDRQYLDKFWEGGGEALLDFTHQLVEFLSLRDLSVSCWLDEDRSERTPLVKMDCIANRACTMGMPPSSTIIVLQ